MNLTKIIRIAAVFFTAALGFASPSQAAVTAFFSAGPTCGGASSASFSTGGPAVQVSLCMTTTAPTATCGHTIVLQAAAAGESGRFVVTAPVTLGSGYSDPNSEVSQLPLAVNNPATVADFGGTSSAPVAAAANQLLATFNLAPQASATNASYVISLNTVSTVAVDADTTCGATTVPTEAPITASFTLNRNNAPVFTSASSTTFSTTTAANTFTVTATGNPTPTISAGALPAGVAFSSGGANSGFGTLTTTIAGASGGTITFTAAGSSSVQQTFTLSVAGQASQTITFANPGTQPFSATPLSLTATASSGLTVAFTTITPTVCSVSVGGSLTMLTLGTCTIAANQAGNASYLAATQVLQSFGLAGAVPGAPTIGIATAGNNQASIAFTAPANNGGSAILSYTMSCSGISASGNSSPITVSGLTNGNLYTCAVTATNSLGTGPASATVNVTPVNSALALVSVVSRKTHGTAGAFDVPIDYTILNAPGSLVSVEPRTAGTGYNIVFQFNGTISAAGTASLSSAGTATATTTGNNEVQVAVTGVTDKTRVTVSLVGVNGTTPASATIGFLIGDQDGSRLVQGGDVSVIRARSGQAANTTNFRADLDASGVIGGGDISTVRARSGNALP